MNARRNACARYLVIFWVVCAVLALPALAQSVKIEVMIWETDELDMDALFDVTGQFTRGTFIGVELLVVPFAEYREQLLARLMGGDAPDLFWVTQELLGELVAAGLVLSAGYRSLPSSGAPHLPRLPPR